MNSKKKQEKELIELERKMKKKCMMKIANDEKKVWEDEKKITNDEIMKITTIESVPSSLEFKEVNVESEVIDQKRKMIKICLRRMKMKSIKWKMIWWSNWQENQVRIQRKNGPSKTCLLFETVIWIYWFCSLRL